MPTSTELERQNLEAHVDLCAIRYEALEGRLDKVETKIDTLHDAISNGQQSMTKVIIGASGTIVTGLLSVIIVILMQ
jgi:hypothetical protein|tara:strand:+ start:233 stop:463 length:231 start_codon:yes stop_codon:yes gene_type:complete